MSASAPTAGISTAAWAHIANVGFVQRLCENVMVYGRTLSFVG